MAAARTLLIRTNDEQTMSFQAYLEAIQRKTGLDANALKAASDARGLSEKGCLKRA
jgi:hypothetical protein